MKRPITIKVPLNLANVVVLTRITDIPIDIRGDLTAVEVRPITTTSDFFVRVRANNILAGTSITLIEGNLKRNHMLTWFGELPIIEETQFTFYHCQASGTTISVRLSATIKPKEGL